MVFQLVWLADGCFEELDVGQIGTLMRVSTPSSFPVSARAPVTECSVNLPMLTLDYIANCPGCNIPL